MKNTIKILGIVVLIAIIGFSMIGCNKKAASSASSSSSESSSSVNNTPAPAPAPAPATSGGGSVSVAQFLVEYEKFADEYISLIKKIVGGDFSAANQIEGFEERSKDLLKRFEGLNETDFSSAQMQKYAEITEKIAKEISF